MHGRLDRSAQNRTPSGHIDPVSDHRGSHRVPRRRHRGVMLPCVGGGIVALHLPEYLGLNRLSLLDAACLSAH
jgi:hypothetical protein